MIKGIKLFIKTVFIAVIGLFFAFVLVAPIIIPLRIADAIISAAQGHHNWTCETNNVYKIYIGSLNNCLDYLRRTL